MARLDQRMFICFCLFDLCKNVFYNSLMSLEGPDLLSVHNDSSGTQGSVVVIQLHLTHTANYWSRKHPPSPRAPSRVHTHTHTRAPRGWPFQPSLLAGSSKTGLEKDLSMRAVSVAQPSAERRFPFASPSTSGLTSRAR